MKHISLQKLSALNSSPTRLTLLIYKSGDEYISSLAKAVETAANNAGYQLKILDSQNSAAIQLEQVKSAAKNGEKAIIINLVDANNAHELITAANGMKVIFLNRIPADTSLLNENAVYVGSDDKEAGRLQGKWLSDYFLSIGKNNIKYLLFEGTPGLTTTVFRTASVLSALAENGIASSAAADPIIADFDRTKALYMSFPVFASPVEFDAIISNNDAMALGAIEAAQSLGIDLSRKPVVGIDATYDAVEEIISGCLSMTVFQNAKAQAAAAVTAVKNMLAGKPAALDTGFQTDSDNPYIIWIPFEPVTATNIPKDLEFEI